MSCLRAIIAGLTDGSSKHLKMWFQASRQRSPPVAEPDPALDQHNDPDIPLLRRIAAGDSHACSMLVERHMDRLLAFVERSTGSREDAEEIVQETFLRAWQHAPRWQDRGVLFSTWLHQVAVNQCRDRWRRKPGETVELDTNLADNQPGPQQQFLQADQSARVRSALQQLPERQRLAIVLSHYQGLSNPQAAQVLECSVEAVESLLSRARRELRRTLFHEHQEST